MDHSPEYPHGLYVSSFLGMCRLRGVADDLVDSVHERIRTVDFVTVCRRRWHARSDDQSMFCHER